MTLHYLIFDACDHGDGTGSWDAMASVPADRLPPVRAEVAQAIAEAEATAPGPRGPLDEGGAWDADVHETVEGGRVTVTLVITGPWEWGEALVEAWARE